MKKIVDYYKVLEVDPKADQKDIKAAYLRLSKLWHPDMHQKSDETSTKEAEKKFREIADAYEVLGDAQKRHKYDSDTRMGRHHHSSPHGKTKAQSWSPGGPEYGVDPEAGRRVDVDLSEERMRKAWELYKIRWEKESEQRRILEEKKLEFRILLDKKREMYDMLSEEEKLELRDSMRLFRNPFQTNRPFGAKFYSSHGKTTYRKQDSLLRNAFFASHQFSEDESGQIRQEQTTDSNSSRSEDEKQKVCNEKASKKTEEILSKTQLQKQDLENDSFVQSTLDSMKFDHGKSDYFDHLLKDNKDEKELHEDLFYEERPQDRFRQRQEEDPIQFSKSTSYSEIYREMKARSSDLKKDWEKAQFLSDGGPASGTSTPEYRISKWMIQVLMAAFLLVGIGVYTLETSDPCDGNVFMEELRKKQRLEKEIQSDLK